MKEGDILLIFKNEQLLDNEIKKLTKLTKYISIVRLIIAIFLLVFAVSLISLGDYALYGSLSAIFLILLILFILLTNRFYDSLELKKRKKHVYMLHEKRRNKEYSQFLDTGNDFIDSNDYKQLDLDIFGNNSLYQYLSICKTKKGRELLAKKLTNPEVEDNGYTKAIYEMANCEDMLDVEASLYNFQTKAKSVDYEEFNSIGSKINIKFIDFIPLLSFVFMITYLVLIFTNGFNPIGIVIPLILNVLLSRINSRHNVMKLNATLYYNLCDSYINTIKVINTVSLNNECFNTIKTNINNELINLKKLRGAYSLLSSRGNIIFSLILNSALIFDLWLLLLLRVRCKNLSKINVIFDEVARLEAMMSLANVGMDSLVYCIPNTTKHIIAKGIYHPLVKDCVLNDIEIDQGIILTGSNMSGKTTFMRTIGINQVLFNAGSIVCAESYYSYYFEVITSLRANDMLSEGISTFYAEILRMKAINKGINEQKCLILIDEIFKGTNAFERISASIKIIERLNSSKSLFIISTHDFELCDCEGIINYHFNEEYDDNKISFDYKIKEGKCESKNALYLLKMADII